MVLKSAKKCCYKLNSSVLAIILTGRHRNALCNNIHILFLPLTAILCNHPQDYRNFFISSTFACSVLICFSASFFTSWSESS